MNVFIYLLKLWNIKYFLKCALILYEITIEYMRMLKKRKRNFVHLLIPLNISNIVVSNISCRITHIEYLTNFILFVMSNASINQKNRLLLWLVLYSMIAFNRYFWVFYEGIEWNLSFSYQMHFKVGIIIKFFFNYFHFSITSRYRVCFECNSI